MNFITCPHCGESYPDFDAAHVCTHGLYAPKLESGNRDIIDTIADKCRETITTTEWPYSFSTLNERKFAELIIQECLCAVEDAGGIDKYHYTKAISEHFGVKE